MSAFYLFLGPTKSTSILLFPLLGFLLFLALIYVAVWKLSKEAGELEANSYQIVVKDHEIEAIHAKEHFITLKGEDISDLKLGFLMLKFKPKNYRKIMQPYEMDIHSLKAHEWKGSWMGIKVPQISKKDRIKLKRAIDEFKKRNNIG